MLVSIKLYITIAFGGCTYKCNYVFIIRVSFTMKQAALSAKLDGIIELYSEEVAFIFDQHKILTIEVSVLCMYMMYIAYSRAWFKDW